MQFDASDYLAWQQAEQRAAAAARTLFSKVLADDPRSLPSRQEVDEVRALRDHANALLHRMLDHMRDQAASLHHRRMLPGDGRSDQGFRSNAFVPAAKG